MLYDLTIPAFMKALGNLSLILDKVEAEATEKKIDVDFLLQDRLTPNMFNFIRQVQITCDTAKLGAARLTGKEAPKHDDSEKSMSDLKNRIQETRGFLEGLSHKDFDGAEERHISQPRWEGKYLTGKEYALEHVLPNLYFHFTTAYAILRRDGMTVGKKDYLGAMPYKMP